MVLMSYMNNEHIVIKSDEYLEGMLESSFCMICLMSYRRYLQVNCLGLFLTYSSNYSGRMNYGGF